MVYRQLIRKFKSQIGDFSITTRYILIYLFIYAYIQIALRSNVLCVCVVCALYIYRDLQATRLFDITNN